MELMDFLRHARSFLEERWRDYRDEKGMVLPSGAAPSTDMCRFSACFLACVLEDATGEEWLVAGGTPDDTDERKEGALPGEGGILGSDGRWHGHYWLVDSAWDRLIDLTADQFGHEPIIFSDTDDRRFIDNYHDGVVQDHLQYVSFRAAQWRHLWHEYLSARGLMANASLADKHAQAPRSGL